MKLVNDKIFLTGNYLKHYVYENPLFLGARNNKRVYPKRSENVIFKLAMGNARNRLIEILRCNTDLRYFITLTYAQSGKDLLESNDDFRLFIKRLKHYLKNTYNTELKYLAVPELQKKRFRTRGEFAIHYHLVINSSIEAGKLADIWKFGFVKIKYLQGSVDYPAFYISKYLTKDFIEEVKKIKPKFCHYYYYSRNLNRPIALYGYDALVLKKFAEQDLKFINRKNFKSDRLGDITVDNYESLANLSQYLEELEGLKNQENRAILPLYELEKRKRGNYEQEKML